MDSRFRGNDNNIVNYTFTVGMTKSDKNWQTVLK